MFVIIELIIMLALLVTYIIVRRGVNKYKVISFDHGRKSHVQVYSKGVLICEYEIDRINPH